MSTHHRLTRLFLAALLAIPDSAFAICPIYGFYRYVGDTASDNQCTDNDIQSAIDNASTTCRTNIVITREHTYTTQALVISNKSVSLQGVGDGVPCNYKPGICDPSLGCGGGGTTTGPLVTLHGNGSASVLYINGNSDVTLQSIELTGGGGTDYGGGIHFSGTGSLTLVDSTVTLNSATYGGGIQFNGSGGNATLTLGADTIIDENTAGNDGGGIQINGSARLFALEPNAIVGFNHAPNGRGGGAAIVGPARADIASPGYGGVPVVYFNDAANGGGLAVIDDGHGEAVLRVFAHDASHPTIISENTATTNGGGLYLYGLADACLFAARLDQNVGEDGAAIYEYGSGGIYINGGSPSRLGTDCGPETIYDLGGVSDCYYNAHCNAMTENQTLHGDGTASAGSIIYHTYGELVGSRIRLQSNIGAWAIAADYGGTLLSRCLLTDNSLSTGLIRSDVWGSGYTQFNQCTFAHNSIGGPYVMQFLDQNLVSLTDDIIAEPGLSSMIFTPYGTGDVVTVGYTMSNDISTLPHSGNPSVVQDDPHFVDVGAGDYHLRNDSPALDFAPAIYNQSLDYAFGPFDLPSVVNRFGPTDLGAYELISTDRIFANGIGDAVPPLDCVDHCY